LRRSPAWSAIIVIYFPQPHTKAITAVGRWRYYLGSFLALMLTLSRLPGARA
jgi:hypothetical protein